MSRSNPLRNYLVIAAIPFMAIGLSACGGSSEKPAEEVTETEVDTTAPEDHAADTEATEADAGEAVDLAAIIDQRQKSLKRLGKNFKGISDAIKTGTADSEDTLQSIKIVSNLAPRLKTWFPEGSGPESGLETEAKAEIWAQPEEFAKAAADFEAAALVLQAAGDAGDADAIKAAFGQVGGTCKGCHDTFKSDDEH